MSDTEFVTYCGGVLALVLDRRPTEANVLVAWLVPSLDTLADYPESSALMTRTFFTLCAGHGKQVFEEETP